MSSTVQLGSMQVSSTGPAEEVVAALTEPEDEKPKPVVTRDKGQPVDPEEAKVKEAASKLGKRGAEAAAKARKVSAAEPEEARDAAKGAKAAPEDEPESKEPEEKPEEAKGKHNVSRHDPVARREQARQEMLEATRQAAEAKRELQRIQAEVERAKTQAPAPVAPERPAERRAPVLDEFLARTDDYNKGLQEWVEARDKFNREEWEREAQTKQQRAEAEHRITQTIGHIDRSLEAFHGRLEKAGDGDIEAFRASLSDDVRNCHPSFTREDNEPLTPRHTFADEIIRSEHAPALLLHYSEHPDEFSALLALRTPEDVKAEVRATARILAREGGAVTAGTSARSRESKAPPPPRPVGGALHTANQDDDDVPMSERVRRFGERELAASRR